MIRKRYMSYRPLCKKNYVANWINCSPRPPPFTVDYQRHTKLTSVMSKIYKVHAFHITQCLVCGTVSINNGWPPKPTWSTCTKQTNKQLTLCKKLILWMFAWLGTRSKMFFGTLERTFPPIRKEIMFCLTKNDRVSETKNCKSARSMKTQEEIWCKSIALRLMRLCSSILSLFFFFNLCSTEIFYDNFAPM